MFTVTSLNPMDLAKLERELVAQGCHHGTGTRSRPWIPGAATFALDDTGRRFVHNLGERLVRALAESRSRLLSGRYPHILDAERSEGAWFNSHAHSLLAPNTWRVDLLWGSTNNQANPSMWLVDVNLMPGMAGITSGLQRASQSVLSEGGALYLDEAAWLRGLLQPFPAESTIHYVVRREHALVPDSQILCRLALEYGYGKMELAYLDELAFSCGQLWVKEERVRAVHRQVRAFSKHSDSQGPDPHYAALENARTADAVICDPDMVMSLESHAWMALWQETDEAFESGWATFVPRSKEFPRKGTGTDSIVRRRLGESAHGLVIKRFDSTGSHEQITVDKGASDNILGPIVRMLTKRATVGWLIQDRVLGHFPLEAETTVDAKDTAPLKFAVYFVEEMAVGGHVVMPSQNGELRIAGLDIMS